jgi:hypothetical protein
MTKNMASAYSRNMQIKTWSSVFDFGLVMLVKMNGLSSGLSFKAAGRPFWAWAAPPVATTWGQRYKTLFP